MSLKGKIFTADDAPPSVLAGTSDEINAWCNAQTERYRIVATDSEAAEGDQALIAEELAARAIARLPETLRRMVPVILRMPPAQRIALRAAFDDDGNLIIPFTPVP